MKTSLQTVRQYIAAAILFCASIFTVPLPAQAQAGVSLTINSCDDNNYPEIICTVTPVDQAGVPVQNLQADAFEIIDGTTPATLLKAEAIENPSVKTNVMLIVDFGTSSRNVNAVAALKQSAEQILSLLAPDDEVALIGVTGNIDLGDPSNPPIDPAKESAFVNAGQQRNGVINIIRTLAPSAGTPLFDAVCKGLTLINKQTSGRRALIILSDGKDVGSKVCTKDTSASNASRALVPVYGIGIGDKLDEAYLQNLALATGGSYLKAFDVADVAPKFATIQKTLKTQYRLTFNAVTPADNNPQGHPLTIRVNTAAGKATENTTFKALYPVKPIVEFANFKQGDSAFDLSTPLPYGEVEVLPQIKARNLARVEYVLNGEVVKVAEQEPFAFVMDVADPKLNLTPDRKHVLVIRAYGEMTNPANTTEGKYEFDVEGPPPTATPLPAGANPVATQPPRATPKPGQTAVPLPTATPTPTGIGATLSRNPLLGVLLGILALGIGALIALMTVLQRRRAQAARIAAAANEPQTIMDMGGNASSGGDVATDGNQTKVFGTGALSGVGDGKTKVFRPGKATLEFTNGKMKDKKFQIGVGGMDAVLVGREVDVNIGNIKLDSEFVSRRHARITLESDKLYVYDLGSSSGTRVNGQDLAARAELRDGDTVEFGDVQAKVTMNAVSGLKPLK